MKYIVVSDLHLSTEEHLDDFYSDEEFSQMLEVIARDHPTTLIFNGDTIDFLQSLPEADREMSSAIYCDSESARKIVDRVYKRHKQFFAALSEFIKREENRIIFLKGNHDAELAFESVKKGLIDIIGTEYKDRILFPEYGHLIKEHGIYIEHGNQYDRLNSFTNFQSPFCDAKKSRIELPLGSILVRTLWNRLERSFPFIDKIRPMTASISLAIALRPLFWAFRFDYFMDMFFHMIIRDFSPRNLLKKSVDVERLSPPEQVSLRQTRLLQFGGITLITLLLMVTFFFVKGLFFLDVAEKTDIKDTVNFTISLLTHFLIYISIGVGFYITGKMINRLLSKKPQVQYLSNVIFRIFTGLSFGFILYALIESFWIPILVIILLFLLVDMHRSITREISSTSEDIERPFPEEIATAKALLKLSDLRFVIFGHTHLARFLMIDEMKYLINSGTWIYNLDLYSLENRNFMQTFVLIDDRAVSLNVFYGLKGFITLKNVTNTPLI